MHIEEYVEMAPFTTLRIGGRARFFARARSADDIREGLAFAEAHDIPVFVLGGGSNILVSDEGFSGLVIKIEMTGFGLREDGERVFLSAAAGEEWDALVERAVREDLWGIENLSAIPGTVGAAPVQNIGAYGAECADTLYSVEVLDREMSEARTLSRDECEFGYRTSVFKKYPGRFVILSVTFALSKNGKPNLSYRDMSEALSSQKDPSLARVRSAVEMIRKGKFPNLREEGTAGSFFLNPVVGDETAQRLSALVPGLPCFKQKDGTKISLAYLLDKGLGLRGLCVGRARLFERQPLVIAASFGASSGEVAALASEVEGKILAAYGIEIEPEVRML